MAGDGDGWDWVSWGGMEECGCLIFARHASPEQMIAAFGLDPGTAWLGTPGAAPGAITPSASSGKDEDAVGPAIYAGKSGEWAFVIDESVLSTKLAVKGHRVPLHLPVGTETAVVTWTPTISSAEYWADGEKRAEFDSDLEDPELFLGQAGLNVEAGEAADFEAPETGTHLSVLRMLTAALGIRVPEETATGPLLCCRRPSEPAGAPEVRAAAPGRTAATTVPSAPVPTAGGTTAGNLGWLADSPVAQTQAGFCLTLARGVTEEEMFAAFGADPQQARPRHWEDLQDVMHVQVGRSGDWIFALELNSVNGTRPRVLNRVSADGEAIAVHSAGPGVHHQLACSVGGNLAAAVDGLSIGRWKGSDAERFRGLAEQAGLMRPRPDRLRGLLTVAERACDAALVPSDLDRALPAAELPPLPLEEMGFCLTFVQGASEEEVFAAFGADPADAVPRRRRELEHGMYVQVGRSGDWLFALELISDRGIKARTLRRLSARGRAVAVRSDGGLDADFGYAENGGLAARVSSASPHRWTGSDPDRFRDVAREVGLAGTARMLGPDAVRSMLTLAERASGVPAAEAGGDRPWPTAPILPRLRDVPAYAATSSADRIGDPEIQSLVASASDAALIPVLAARMRRLLADSGLDASPELARAVDAALADRPQPPTDTDPVGKILRLAAWKNTEAGVYLCHPHRQGQPPGLEPDFTKRKHLLGDAVVVRLVLAGQYRQALVSDLIHHRNRDPDHWTDQALADLAALRTR